MLSRGITLGLISVLFFLGGCTRQDEPATSAVRAKPRPAPGPKGPPAKDFQTPWQTESEYIVTMVAADLTEMAYFAKQGRVLTDPLPVEVREMSNSSESAPIYQVKARLGDAGEVTCVLPITQALWAPVTYAPLVRQLFGKLQLPAAPAVSSDDTTVFAQLQDLRVETLTRLDGELSARLAREFTTAERHEEAAALLGAFTLRQSDGLFYQIRVELCRMSAHLAFANGLRAGGPPGVTGRIGEAMLTALYNNQADALKLLATVPDDGDAGVWKRTLRMRASGDFRIYGESRTQKLCEELEWFRARADSVSVERAWQSLRLSDEQALLSDWTRVMSTGQPSVQLGHVVLRAALPVELREVTVAYEGEAGKTLEKERLVEVLNAEPQRCVATGPDGKVSVRIVGWGTWAAFLQRQLCQVLAADFIFMRDRWGVPEEAKQFQESIDPQFWGLRLYPFVRRQCAPDHDYYRKAQDDEMAIVRQSPQVVPAMAWNYISYGTPVGQIYWPPPHPFLNEWHRPNPVPGTAYNPWPRMSHRSLTERADLVARLERMHQLAPYDVYITHNLLHFRDGEKQTAELIEKNYAAVLEFQTSPLRKLIQWTKDPDTKEKWIRKSAALDPSDYYSLAKFYIDQHREDDAAQAYVEWIDNEIDEVAVSNSAEWLVKYFERKRDIASARNLANRVAETYSSKGLLTKARLLERIGETKAALEFYLKQAERYTDYGPTLGFLIRLKASGSDESAGVRESLLKEYLPSGLVKFDKVAKGAPGIGVQVPPQGPGPLRPGSPIEAAGLRRGEVVVAVNGYRVADWNSFKVLRNLEPEQPYVLTVWRDNQYVELPPLAPGYRFGVDLLDYRAP